MKPLLRLQIEVHFSLYNVNKNNNNHTKHIEFEAYISNSVGVMMIMHLVLTAWPRTLTILQHSNCTSLLFYYSIAECMLMLSKTQRNQFQKEYRCESHDEWSIEEIWSNVWREELGCVRFWIHFASRFWSGKGRKLVFRNCWFVLI